MIIGKTTNSVSKKEILEKYSETRILKAVFPEITELPCKMCSPFRIDKYPSFSVFVTNEGKVRYRDFGNSEQGSLYDMLGKLWSCTFNEVLSKIERLMSKGEIPDLAVKSASTSQKGTSNRIMDLQVTIRKWRDYDYEYWNAYGITDKWLRYAEVYPISHKIITIQNKFTGKPEKHTFPADKHAYCFVERKDSKLSLKIYQPFNTKGFKWCGKMDASVWSLWTKIPQTGDNLIISSSLKDCLNLSCQLHIPAICMQGEGYMPKPQIMEELKQRFKQIIIFFDNDFQSQMNTGHEDAMRLSSKFQIPFVEIPACYQAKDPSDLFKKYGREKYVKIMKDILDPVIYKKYPFPQEKPGEEIPF